MKVTSATPVRATRLPIGESPGHSWQWFGPGLIMAVTGIGASDIISATVGGATYGVALLWALALGAFIKFVLTEGIARWQLATGLTLLEGWARYLPRRVLVVFAVYLAIWAIAVGGALVSGCGMAIENATSGAVSRRWGALAHAVGAFAFIYATRAGGLARVMKPLIGIMTLSIVGCAALTFREPMAALRGLLVPVIPAGGGAYVLSLIGGIGGSLTLLSYNHLLRDEDRVHPRHLRDVRIDLAIAYLFTAGFGLSVMLIAHQVFHTRGLAITDGEAVSLMAGELAAIAGRVGFHVYSLGFWAAVIASLVGVWQTVPSLIVDCHSLLMRLPVEERGGGIKADSRPYRLALSFMALVSVPFAFLGRPLLVVVTFTVIGSLFIPFLAATLLYLNNNALNNRVSWDSAVPKNSIATNALLVVVLLLFLIVGGLEVWELF